MSMSRLTRRTLIERGTLAIGASLLAACSSPSTPAPTSAPAGTTAPASKPGPAVVSKAGRLALPQYIAPNSPPPDVPGGTITPPGYTKYPSKLIRSVTDTPSKGGQITIVTQTLG